MRLSSLFRFAVAWLALACGPSVAQAPLSNTEPDGHDVYYYGDVAGGKELPDTATPEAPQKTAPKPVEKAQAKAKETNKPTTERQNPEPAANKSAANGATENAQRPFADLPGSYSGTDTVTIRFEGSPERVEEDDNAKLVVEAGDAGAFVFKIIDSRNGGDLCAVTGKPDGARVKFEPRQTCLQEILGVPMKATLKSGSATITDGKLVVDYAIDIEIDAPQGTTEGAIDYHFEGSRE